MNFLRYWLHILRPVDWRHKRPATYALRCAYFQLALFVFAFTRNWLLLSFYFFTFFLLFAPLFLNSKISTCCSNSSGNQNFLDCHIFNICQIPCGFRSDIELYPADRRNQNDMVCILRLLSHNSFVRFSHTHGVRTETAEKEKNRRKNEPRRRMCDDYTENSHVVVLCRLLYIFHWNLTRCRILKRQPFIRRDQRPPNLRSLCAAWYANQTRQTYNSIKWTATTTKMDWINKSKAPHLSFHCIHSKCDRFFPSVFHSMCVDLLVRLCVHGPTRQIKMFWELMNKTT